MSTGLPEPAPFDAHVDALVDVFVFLSREARGFGCPAVPAGECFRRYRVAWCGSRAAPDGHGVVWHFQAPDAESVRVALRHAGIDFDDARRESVSSPGEVA